MYFREYQKVYKQPASIQTSCPTLAEVPKVQGTIETTAAEFSLTWTFIARNGDQHAVKQLMLKRGHGVCHKNVATSWLSAVPVVLELLLPTMIGRKQYNSQTVMSLFQWQKVENITWKQFQVATCWLNFEKGWAKLSDIVI